ncbi:MAG: polyphenol oxidase family protein [Candidatus Gracilibacteria bacterium]|jgi:copper oxidase (laccase) domain-containing protein|nr:polyphenol oxidase family protein [Candidatus Gracilibacteria bacterium]
MISAKFFTPYSSLPKGIVFPKQTHSNNIKLIERGDEDLDDCDGIITDNIKLKLGILTADCASLVFIEKERFALVHAGWRGLLSGIIENTLEFFKDPEVFVMPFSHIFEIQKDNCYLQIQRRFGDDFFINNRNRVYFDFHSAIKSIVPSAQFDPRNTYLDKSLASYRRDNSKDRNVTIVGNLEF